MSVYPDGMLQGQRQRRHLYVRYMSVDTATQRSTAIQDDTGQRRNGPHSREFAASGPFSQVVAGVGFEPT